MKVIKYTETAQRLFIGMLIAFGAYIAEAASLPDAAGGVGPTTVFPSSFSDFKPPIDPELSIEPNAPQIAEWTRQNQPGDTMIVTGENFSSFTNLVADKSGYVVALQSDGVDDYIDTDLIPQDSWSFEIDGVWNDPGGKYNLGHGSEYSGKDSFSLLSSDRHFKFGFKDRYVESKHFNDGFRHTLYIDRTKYGVDGDYTSWTTAGRFSRAVAINLFKWNPAYGTPHQALTIYRATIKDVDTGAVLYNWIPQADGTLLETVNNVVYTNDGSGELLEIRDGSQVPYTSGEYGKDSAFVFYGEDGDNLLDSGLIQRLDGRQAVVTLPESLPNNQFYLLWPHNDHGFGLPVAINKPQGWMVLPKYATKGDDFSIYGRNLVVDKDNPVSYAYCVERNEWLSTTSANPYKADYKIPMSWGNGTYTLWPHNGTGGKYGWGEPVEIVVNSDMDWSLGNTIELSDHGGVGNGAKDNIAAFRSAINAANAGDTIHVGDGTFMISSGLPDMQNLRLLGNGMSKTVITSHPNWEPDRGSDRMLPRKMVNVEVSDLTFDGGLYRELNMILYPIVDGSKRVVCTRVKFTTESNPNEFRDGTFISLSSCPNSVLRDCDMISGCKLDLGSVPTLVERCNFYGMYDVGLLILSRNSSDISITECTAQNLDDSDARSWRGWCQGRFYHGQGLYGAVKNTYFGGNTTYRLTPRLPEPWVTEQPMAVTDTSFKFSVAGVNKCDSNLYDKYAQITSGTGAHWVNKFKITEINKATGLVTLEGTWDTNPDTSSTIEIVDAINNRNTGEQWMCEFTDTQWRDYAVTSTANSVKISSLKNNYDGQIITVIDGKGLGQSRVIKGDTSSGTAMVTEPWNVMPDTSSMMAIGNFVYRSSIYGNYFDGTDMAVEDDPNVAVEGVSIYGGNVEVCVEDNTFHKMRRGTSTWGIPSKVTDQYPGENIYRQNFFNHNENNLYDSCRTGISTHAKYTFQRPLPLKLDRCLFGHVYRRNTILNTFDTAVVFDVEAAGLVDTQVFDGNIITGFSQFMKNADGLAGQAWVGNKVTSLNGGVGMIISEDHFPILQGNTWSGFSSAYGGALTGPVLEAPVRDLSVSNGTYTIKLSNIGTDMLRWNASVDQPNNWVSLRSTSGIILNEATGSLTIDVNAAGVNSGAKANISISDGLNTRQVTLIYEASESIDPLPDYTVSFSSDSNGYISSGAVTQSVAVNGNASSVEATANEGYHFLQWTGSYVSTENPLVLVNVTSDVSLKAEFAPDSSSGEHGITREVWLGMSRATMSALITDSRYPDSPDLIEVATSFEAPEGFGSNYGTQMHGYLVPPVTGSYTFWVAGDDICELWLSSDALEANCTKIAEVSSWTNPREWSKYSSQQSASVSLQAGERYYIKALHREGAGGDHIAVAWQGPGIEQSVISGDYLEPYGSESSAKMVKSLLILGLSDLDELTSSQYGCLATYSDGSIASVSPDWKIITGPASISSEGILVAGDVLSDQTALVLASYGDQDQTKLISIRYSVPIASRLKIIAPAIVDELSTVQLEGRIAYSDGTSKVASPVWATDAAVAFVDSEGQLITADVLTNVQLTVTATLNGSVATHEITIRVAEDQVIYPLNGYEGRSVRAEIYDDVDGVLQDLGQLESPTELVIEDFTPGRWYWLTITEYDEGVSDWVKVQENWINM